MKYLYYTLYLFFVKILHLHKQYPPIINITAVMAFLINCICFAFVNTYQLSIGIKFQTYSALIPFSVYVIWYKLLYEYYKPREAKLLNKISKKHLWIRIIIVLISICFIILAVKLWMFDGMMDIYQYVKNKGW